MGLPLGGLLHHVRFSRADGSFSAQDRQRAGLLAKRLGLTVELRAGPTRSGGGGRESNPPAPQRGAHRF